MGQDEHDTGPDADDVLGGGPHDVFDVVVLGAGSAGEVVAVALAEAGRRVAAVEGALVGGECPYLACVPSKAMLLAARRHRAAVREAAGGAPQDARDAVHAPAWADAVRRRDEASAHRDDGGSASALVDAGVTLVRGRGRVTARDPSGRGGVVTVRGENGGERRLGWRDALVVGTGSTPSRPPVAGLDMAPTWTSDEALSSAERPARLVVLGGGAVGCELAQVYASFGVAVTLVEPAPTLLAAEPGWVGGLLADALRGNGVDVRVGVAAEAVEKDGDGAAAVLVRLGDGSAVPADRVLVATGRAPRTADLGLEVLDVPVEQGSPLTVDARCRVVAVGGVESHEDVFAVGDVTGVAPYTHTASYQGRIVAAHLLGTGRDADYSGVPRAVYTDPPVYSVGDTAAEARQARTDVLVARFDVAETARAFVEQVAGTVEPVRASGAAGTDGTDDTIGQVELVCDARTGVLVGAAAVGPAADAWAGELALAVRARVTVEVLADHVRAFPTWAEALRPPAQELADSRRAALP